MRPVDQLLFVDRDGHGDCLRACVASVLELPLNRVPDFGLFAWNWMFALAAYCECEPVVPGEAGTEGVWIAFGQSARGLGHAVVFEGHAMVHDPHPSRSGLVGAVEGGVKLGPIHNHVRRWLSREQATPTKEPPMPDTTPALRAEFERWAATSCPSAPYDRIEWSEDGLPVGWFKGEPYDLDDMWAAFQAGYAASVGEAGRVVPQAAVDVEAAIQEALAHLRGGSTYEAGQCLRRAVAPSAAGLKEREAAWTTQVPSAPGHYLHIDAMHFEMHAKYPGTAPAPLECASTYEIVMGANGPRARYQRAGQQREFDVRETFKDGVWFGPLPKPTLLAAEARGRGEVAGG